MVLRGELPQRGPVAHENIFLAKATEYKRLNCNPGSC